jgi:hypothetical protein
MIGGRIYRSLWPLAHAQYVGAAHWPRRGREDYRVAEIGRATDFICGKCGAPTIVAPADGSPAARCRDDPAIRGKRMSKGRERTIQRRKRNGEFLDALPWPTTVGNYLLLTTRRGFRSFVELIEPVNPAIEQMRRWVDPEAIKYAQAVSLARMADLDAGRANDRTR